jgi:uncharacterized membrane protein
VKFVRATLLGGVVFLVPIVVLGAIIGKAFRFFHQIAVPFASALSMEAIAGIPAPRILAVVLFCFLAGLFARTGPAKRIVGWLESALLSNIPGYSMMKSMGENMAGVQGTKVHDVVLARIEDAWQYAFVVERLREGQVAVFVPGAPNPWSGSVYLMAEDRIKPLDVPLATALKCIKGLGLGSDALTRGQL